MAFIGGGFYDYENMRYDITVGWPHTALYDHYVTRYIHTVLTDAAHQEIILVVGCK